MNALLGEWEMEFSFEVGILGPGGPAVSGLAGRTTFQWFDCEFFLIQRATLEDPSVPSGIMIIGVGTDPETFVQHYYDSRGAARRYQMSLNKGTWEAVAGSARLPPARGVFSESGDRITGAWEKSVDGWEWKKDFDLTYIKT